MNEKGNRKMDKIISLLILLVLFTGCAAQSTSAVDYNNPYSIQEENYASYEDWVEEELSIIQYYTDCTNQELEYIRQIALQDHEYFREQMRLFNEQVDAFNQQQVNQQNDMAQQQFDQQQQMFDQQVQMSNGF